MAAALALGAASQVIALEVRDYDINVNRRLINFPGEPIYHQTPAVNPNCFINAGLFLGIGWPADPKDWTRQMALVSPRHMVCATHYPLTLSWKIAFLGKDGKQHLYGIESQKPIIDKIGRQTDLTLVTLSSSVNPSLGITPFPALNLPNEASFTGKPLVVCGSFVDTGINVIKGFTYLTNDPGFDTTRFIYYEYDRTAVNGNANDCTLRPGDSGGPNFVMVNGQPAIVGTNSGYDDLTLNDPNEIGPVFRNYIASIPSYLNELDALMNAKGYHMKRFYPAATTVSTTVVAAAPLHEMKSGSIWITTRNSGAAMAHNVSLTLRFVTAPSSVGGPGWICEALSPTVWKCRRGGIAKAANATITAIWTSLPALSTLQMSIAQSYDGGTSIVTIPSLPISAAKPLARIKALLGK